MLKVIAIVLMLGAGPNGERDTYIFTDPVHNGMQECIAWVQGSVPQIYQLMGSIYGNRGIEQVFCMEQRRLEEYFGYTFEEFKESQQDGEVLPPKQTPKLGLGVQQIQNNLCEYYI